MLYSHSPILRGLSVGQARFAPNWSFCHMLLCNGFCESSRLGMELKYD